MPARKKPRAPGPRSGVGSREREVSVIKVRVVAVLATAAWGIIGCARSTPAPEVPANTATPSSDVATSRQPAEPAPEPVAVMPVTPPAPAVPPAPPLTGEQTAAMYEACWGHFNTRNWAEFENCYADDAVGMEAGNPQTYKGKHELIDKTSKLLAAAFPDGKGELQLTMINGKQVAAVALFKGTHTGPLTTPMGELAPTHKKVGFLMAHHVLINDQNKVQKQWVVFDGPTLMAQLGQSKAKARKALSQGTDKPLVELAKNDDAEKSNIASHSKAYDLFNQHDRALFDMMASDIVQSDISMPKDTVGKGPNKKAIESMWKGFSDLRIEPQGIWAAGTHTLSIGQLKGTNDGDLPELGLKKTGRAINTFYVEFVDWKDGKAARIMAFQNGLELAMQLGLVPEPGAAEEPGSSQPEANPKPPAKKLAPEGSEATKPPAEASADPNKKATAPN